MFRQHNNGHFQMQIETDGHGIGHKSKQARMYERMNKRAKNNLIKKAIINPIVFPCLLTNNLAFKTCNARADFKFISY